MPPKKPDPTKPTKDLKCFACGKKTSDPTLVDTRDGQTVYVGKECYKRIKESPRGYQPPQGGPKLYLLKDQGK